MAAAHEYFSGARSEAEKTSYREKKNHLKKLRDEVTPVLHYVKFYKLEGEIRFELSDRIPDCWLRGESSQEPQGIEVTVAQSREQVHLGRELNEKGEGRGFLGLPDDASEKDFFTKLAEPRTAYCDDEALRVVKDGIKRCLSKKNKPQYKGFDLLIGAPLSILPSERWSRIKGDLWSSASSMPFRQIHIIGDKELFGFRIK